MVVVYIQNKILKEKRSSESELLDKMIAEKKKKKRKMKQVIQN